MLLRVMGGGSFSGGIGMKVLVVLALSLAFCGSVSAQTTLVPNTELGVNYNDRARQNSGDDLDGLTFNLKSVVFKTTKNEDLDEYTGGFQIVVDVYGSNREDGAKSINLRKFVFTAFNWKRDAPEAVVGYGLDAVDVLYEKLDQDVSYTYTEWFGGDLIVKPLARVDTPIRLVLTGHAGGGLIGDFSADNLLPVREAAIAKMFSENWRDHTGFGGVATQGTKVSLQAALDFGNTLRFESGFSRTVQMTGKKAPFYEQLKLDKMDHTIVIPLNKWLGGKKIDLLANYSKYKYGIEAYPRRPDWNADDRDRSMYTKGGLVEVPYLQRTNSTLYFGARVRFGR